MIKEGQNEITDYLDNSLKAGNIAENEKYCKGWNFLKSNVPEPLKKVLGLKEYWDLTCNSKRVKFIVEYFGLSLSKEQEKQLGSFVYLMNEKHREEEKQKEELEILSKGYIKIFGTQKELDGKKVFGIFNLSTIGFLGSYDKPSEQEGILRWADRFNSLMLMPKRSRTKGYLIKGFAFIKYL